MTRKEFWEWMDTCPVHEDGEPSGWYMAKDEGDAVRIFFYFDIEEKTDE